MKEELCKAFCDTLSVRPVPMGFAVSTGFNFPDGDSIGFYVQERDGRFVIKDGGTVFPSLEASGLDLTNKNRLEAFDSLREEYGIQFDGDDREFMAGEFSADAIPAAALRFVSFLLRVGDLLLLAEERVASTFRQDVKRLLEEQIGDRATIEESVPLSVNLDDFLPDFKIKTDAGKLVGLFLGTSDARVLEALYMQLRAEHEAHEEMSIVALIEREKNITARVRQNAANRLDAVPYFRGDEAGAISRIIKEAGLASVH